MKSEKLYQPNELAKICGVRRGTLNTYLRDAKLFPPTKINEANGYRFYSEETINKLVLFKALMKRPFRYKVSEIAQLFSECDFEKLYNLHKISTKKLFEYLLEKDLL